MPLLTRAWAYQERRLSPRTIHFGKQQVYWECQRRFASEDATQESTWNVSTVDSFVPHWGNGVDNCTYKWQKIVMEYTRLQLTYESDRLPAIAALAFRMSQLRRSDDVYIAGIWKNSMLSDLLWETRGSKPRPVRTVPSWSWVSTQNSGIIWDSSQFSEKTEVTSLNYTAIGAANLGEVINASITLKVHVMNLTGIDELLSASSNGSNRGPFWHIFESVSVKKRFRKNKLWIAFINFAPDYDLTMGRPSDIHGCAVKFLVAREMHHGISGIVVRQTVATATECERIGFLKLCMQLPTYYPGQTSEKLSMGSKEARERITESMNSLILSLPMEEVKIV